MKHVAHRLVLRSLPLVATVGIGLAACGGETEDRQLGDVVHHEGQASADVQSTSARRHHWRGPVDVTVDFAITRANVSEAQATSLRAIGDSVRMDADKRTQLHAEMKATAVDLVRVGRTDTAQFEEIIDRARATMDGRMRDTMDAMKDVHTTLDAQQRADVAVALRERINERFGYSAEQRAEHQSEMKARFKRFAKRLALSALQIVQLETLAQMLRDEGERERLHPSRDELMALVDAFEGQAFAEALDDFHAQKSVILSGRFARAGEATDSVLSIFSVGQRALLADLIERGPREVIFGE